ncbi:MAG: IS630 family transposase [Treponema sp.]|uniref:IS630 family transposase n=1 Tax=Treponema sp. TaxID=166 RepID=UPI0025E63B08|nr:IS630 family transposase [Treponema sp.]MBR0495365.1 IS630 family transposase [Treponema sp.]
MGRRMELKLNTEDEKYLREIIKRGTTEARLYKRAMILLMKSEGKTYMDIARALKVSRNTVVLWVEKYKADENLQKCLKDEKGRGRKHEIFDEEIAFIKNTACKKPTEFGYAAEVWSLSKLTVHINRTAEKNGFPRLSTVSVSYVQKLLKSLAIKPHKIEYYCEKRDPDFEEKMQNVLVFYRDVELGATKEDGTVIHMLSYDEKPGIQAVSVTSEDLPATEKNGHIKRDYEYKRLGTVSLLAGIDLKTGRAFPLVKDKHASEDYIDFLKTLDDYYPKEDVIRILLDNLKVHTSEKTKEYLKTRPGRFEFVFTPKHGSWLNMVEGFFSKMSKQVLKGIRVKSKEELKERILKYFEEENLQPVVFHWKYKLDEISQDSKLKIQPVI